MSRLRVIRERKRGENNGIYSNDTDEQFVELASGKRLSEKQVLKLLSDEDRLIDKFVELDSGEKIVFDKIAVLDSGEEVSLAGVLLTLNTEALWSINKDYLCLNKRIVGMVDEAEAKLQSAYKESVKGVFQKDFCPNSWDYFFSTLTDPRLRDLFWGVKEALVKTPWNLSDDAPFELHSALNVIFLGRKILAFQNKLPAEVLAVDYANMCVSYEKMRVCDFAPSALIGQKMRDGAQVPQVNLRVVKHILCRIMIREIKQAQDGFRAKTLTKCRDEAADHEQVQYRDRRPVEKATKNDWKVLRLNSLLKEAKKRKQRAR